MYCFKGSQASIQFLVNLKLEYKGLMSDLPLLFFDCFCYDGKWLFFVIVQAENEPKFKLPE